MSQAWLAVAITMPANNYITAIVVCGSCGIVRLPCMYGLGSLYGSCTLGLEILGYSPLLCIVVVWHLKRRRRNL